MQVAVTGGTGFVGSHTVAALLAGGHRVRLIVRNPDRVAPALNPLGVDPEVVDVAMADITDGPAVAAALTGQEAVIHAASVFSFDPQRTDEIAHINEVGVRNVVGWAVEHGLDPVVHVSSVVALYRDEARGETLTVESPAGNSPYPYAEAKARQESYARSLQADGAPVVTTYPGAVWGPHDPYDGESLRLAQNAIHGKLTLVPDMVLPVCDVRDVAAVHRAVLEPGRGPRRYLIAQNVDMATIVAQVTAAYGRPRKTFTVPFGPVKALAAAATALRRRFGIDLGVDAEAIWLGERRNVAVGDEVADEFGITLRPVSESITDQVRWMKDAGRV